MVGSSLSLLSTHEQWKPWYKLMFLEQFVYINEFLCKFDRYWTIWQVVDGPLMITFAHHCHHSIPQPNNWRLRYRDNIFTVFMYCNLFWVLHPILCDIIVYLFLYLLYNLFQAEFFWEHNGQTTGEHTGFIHFWVRNKQAQAPPTVRKKRKSFVNLSREVSEAVDELMELDETADFTTVEQLMESTFHYRDGLRNRKVQCNELLTQFPHFIFYEGQLVIIRTPCTVVCFKKQYFFAQSSNKFISSDWHWIRSKVTWFDFSLPNLSSLNLRATHSTKNKEFSRPNFYLIMKYDQLVFWPMEQPHHF